jgi:hypothetical protein
MTEMIVSLLEDLVRFHCREEGAADQKVSKDDTSDLCFASSFFDELTMRRCHPRALVPAFDTAAFQRPVERTLVGPRPAQIQGITHMPKILKVSIISSLSSVTFAPP